MNIRELMDKALSTPGGVVVHSTSKEALKAIRYHLYSFRRRDRTLTKQTMGGAGGSRYDILVANIKPGEKGFSMFLLKEDDLLNMGAMTVESLFDNDLTLEGADGGK